VPQKKKKCKQVMLKGRALTGEEKEVKKVNTADVLSTQ
jgi:hypothetical protein